MIDWPSLNESYACIYRYMNHLYPFERFYSWIARLELIRNCIFSSGTHLCQFLNILFSSALSDGWLICSDLRDSRSFICARTCSISVATYPSFCWGALHDIQLFCACFRQFKLFKLRVLTVIAGGKFIFRTNCDNNQSSTLFSRTLDYMLTF